MHSLVAQCPPLDPNSVYCNLLQCHHFSTTSIIAEQKKQAIGFISGYLIPEKPNTLFIWQVAVDQSYRGKGLAHQMLLNLLNRESCASVNHINTTITKDNEASWALFKKIAQSLNTELSSDVLFDEKQHFDGQHHSEYLVSIGPLAPKEQYKG